VDEWKAGYWNSLIRRKELESVVKRIHDIKKYERSGTTRTCGLESEGLVSTSAAGYRNLEHCSRAGTAFEQAFEQFFRRSAHPGRAARPDYRLLMYVKGIHRGERKIKNSWNSRDSHRMPQAKVKVSFCAAGTEKSSWSAGNLSGTQQDHRALLRTGSGPGPSGIASRKHQSIG
jgi:hypothetical protein